MVSNDLKQKQKKAEKIRLQSQNDLRVTRLSIVFVSVLVGVLIMLVAKKNIDNEVTFISYWLTPLLILSVAALAASAVFFAVRTNRHIDDSDRAITKWNVLGAGVVFFCAMLGYRLTFDASLVAIGLVAVGVLYLAYAMFSADFFVYSVMTALGLLLMKLRGVEFYSSFGKVVYILCGALCLVGAVCGILLAIMHISGKGTVQLGKKKLEIGGKVFPIFLGAFFLAVCGVLCLALPAFITYYVAAMLAVYVIIAIAYVIKMM